MKYRVKNKGDEDKSISGSCKDDSRGCYLKDSERQREQAITSVWYGRTASGDCGKVSLHQDIRWRSHWRLEGCFQRDDPQKFRCGFQI